jgi:DNA topoisomerase-1
MYLDHDQFRLYKLIWDRFVASQMTPAEMKVTSIDIDARRDPKFFLFRATATEVVFAGWLKIYGVEEEAEKKGGAGEAVGRGREQEAAAIE